MSTRRPPQNALAPPRRLIARPAPQASQRPEGLPRGWGAHRRPATRAAASPNRPRHPPPPSGGASARTAPAAASARSNPWDRAPARARSGRARPVRPGCLHPGAATPWRHSARTGLRATAACRPTARVRRALLSVPLPIERRGVATDVQAWKGSIPSSATPSKMTCTDPGSVFPPVASRTVRLC